MFKPIITNNDPYRGPALGASGGEHGDNWNDAVTKINEGFANVIAKLKDGGPGGASLPEIQKVVGEILAEAVTDMQNRLAEMSARVAMIEQAFTAMPEAATPNVENTEAPQS